MMILLVSLGIGLVVCLVVPALGLVVIGANESGLVIRRHGRPLPAGPLAKRCGLLGELDSAVIERSS